MIEFKDINKTYTVNGHPYPALKNINLTIHRSEIFGIFGESGAGKSTLLRLINWLETPSHGSVVVNNTNLATLNAYTLKEHRRHVGMIFQHFQLLESRTAYENIALPLELMGKTRAEIKPVVTELLSLVRLENHANHYPSQLSGGQKQRVAIARALVTRPPILLCDEPTSALDPQSTRAILQLLKEINRKLAVTIVLITHEMEVLKQICDRAAILDQGQLVEYGPILALFAKPKAPRTREFVQQALHLILPESIQERLSLEPLPGKAHLVRLTFVGDESGQPLITTLVQQYQITINILQANIEHMQSAVVGFTVCTMAGYPEQIEAALTFIRGTSVTVEVLGYV